MGGFLEHILPGGGGAELGVERGLQVAGVAVDQGAIRHEADGDQRRTRPEVAGRRVGHEPGLESLQFEARSERTRWRAQVGVLSV